MPDNGKIGPRAKVLRDCDRRVQVEDDVPEPAGHEDGLAGMLNYLNLKQKQQLREVLNNFPKTNRFILLWPIGSLRLWINHFEPCDGLVRLLRVVPRANLDELLGRVRGEEAPALVAADQSVPSRRA